MKIVSIVSALSLTLLANGVRAHEPSFQECLEGSEFILHAAQSRDSGMPREDFIARMESDLIAIQNYPREYRWFVLDQDDQAFLMDASKDVFDAPQKPESHQAGFMEACVDRMNTAGTSAEPKASLPNPPRKYEQESRL